jgi:hypothetical protein
LFATRRTSAGTLSRAPRWTRRARAARASRAVPAASINGDRARARTRFFLCMQTSTSARPRKSRASVGAPAIPPVRPPPPPLQTMNWRLEFSIPSPKYTAPYLGVATRW